MLVLPLYLLGVQWLGRFITNRMKDGKLKRLLLRRVSGEKPRQDVGRYRGGWPQ